MGYAWATGQDSEATYTVLVSALPAGTTLSAVEFTCTTTFLLDGSDTQLPGFAPPNTLLGVAWIPHGDTIPVVSESNWTNSEWYVAGFGELTYEHSEPLMYPSGAWQVIRSYGQKLARAVPNYQASAYDLGLSFNDIGAGYYDVTPWFTYQFTAYFD